LLALLGKEPLLKAGEKRCIRDFFGPAELPQFFTETKEEDELGTGRNGKNLLKDKSRKEIDKRGCTFPPQDLMESTEKAGRKRFMSICSSRSQKKEGISSKKRS